MRRREQGNENETVRNEMSSLSSGVDPEKLKAVEGVDGMVVLQDGCCFRKRYLTASHNRPPLAARHHNNMELRARGARWLLWLRERKRKTVYVMFIKYPVVRKHQHPIRLPKCPCCFVVMFYSSVWTPV